MVPVELLNNFFGSKEQDFVELELSVVVRLIQVPYPQAKHVTLLRNLPVFNLLKQLFLAVLQTFVRERL